MTEFNEEELKFITDNVDAFMAAYDKAVNARVAREDAARQQQADRVCEAVREWNRGRQRGDLKALVIEALQ
jgi:hypothetical protein